MKSKTTLLKISAVILTQLLLFSTTSFAVGIHKCSGTIYAVSFTGQVKHCEMFDMPCHFKLETYKGFNSKSCCSEINIVANANIVKQEASLTIHNFKYNVVKHLNNSSFFKVPTIYKNQFFYSDFPPPLPIKNIHLLNQVFLI